MVLDDEKSSGCSTPAPRSLVQLSSGLKELAHHTTVVHGYMGVARGAKEDMPRSKFLENIVILCFERRFPKQNSVIHLKSNILAPPIFLGWLRHCTDMEILQS